MSCDLSVPDFEDVEKLVDTMGPMRRDGLIPNTVYVSNVVEWLGMMGRRKELWRGEGPIPDWRVKELQSELGIGYWNAKWGLYGAPGVVQAHFDEIKKRVEAALPQAKISGKRFAAPDGQVLDAAAIPEQHGGFFVGVPSLWSLPMTQFRLPLPTPSNPSPGIGAHFDYSPIIPSSGKAVLEWCRVAKRVCEKEGFDLFCDFFAHERHVIFVNMMTFNKEDGGQRKSVQAVFQGLFEEGKKRGYSKYRSHVNAMGECFFLFLVGGGSKRQRRSNIPC